MVNSVLTSFFSFENCPVGGNPSCFPQKDNKDSDLWHANWQIFSNGGSSNWIRTMGNIIDTVLLEFCLQYTNHRVCLDHIWTSKPSRTMNTSCYLRNHRVCAMTTDLGQRPMSEPNILQQLIQLLMVRTQASQCGQLTRQSWSSVTETVHCGASWLPDASQTWTSFRKDYPRCILHFCLLFPCHLSMCSQTLYILFAT